LDFGGFNDFHERFVPAFENCFRFYNVMVDSNSTNKQNQMKNLVLLFLLNLTAVLFLYGQENMPDDSHRKAIVALIDQYSQAREKRDTILLKKILTTDVDQLVSNGEWRNGMTAAVQGMQTSSLSNPGTRTLQVDKIRMINPGSAIVDCRYEIQNTDGGVRKMWSSFIVINDNKTWKITAIRNMLPVSAQ